MERQGAAISIQFNSIHTSYEEAYRFDSASPFPVFLRLICFFAGMMTSFSALRCNVTWFVVFSFEIWVKWMFYLFIFVSFII